MQKTRRTQEQAQTKTAEQARRGQGAARSAPQPLDDKLLKQISGGLTEPGAPRGNW
jgi:hypothetical protein